MERLAHVHRHALATTSVAGTLCGGEHGGMLRTTTLNWQVGKEQNYRHGLWITYQRSHDSNLPSESCSDGGGRASEPIKRSN